MGGINSLSGLNNVSVDFRPTITTNVQNTGNTNRLLPEANVVPEEAPPVRGQAKSVVRELDVLLLNAAGKSVSADAESNLRKTVQSLVDKGVLTSDEQSQLERLAEKAQAKLKALDTFSGRDLAKALMIAPRISPAALRATETRLDEAIAHARKLATNGKVYGKAQWQNEENLKDMTGRKATVTITKTDGSKVKPDNNIKCVNDYTERNCPSIFKREYLHQMFDQPEMAA